MFYGYFRPVNFICNVFGVSKPHITPEGESIPCNLLIKSWCLIIGGAFIANYSLSMKTEIKPKDDLELISDINDLVANIIIIIINLFINSNLYLSIHKTFEIIYRDFNFDVIILKIFAFKMYFWFSIPTIIFVIVICLEILSKYPPYDLLIRIPMFLSMMYLFMHLYVKLALIKVINKQLSKTLTRNEEFFSEEDSRTPNKAKYIISPTIKFIKVNDQLHYDIKLLCKIYDNIGTCIRLLEQIHGIQVLISIWLMFTSGVVGMTLIACNKATIKWLVIVKSILPLFWGFIGCYIDEQLRTEVDHTITLIIKCLIDYRCVSTMKPSLEIFKELASNDRLQFTACGLFHLSYAMLLGTILNIITYSIILIQMFLN